MRLDIPDNRNTGNILPDHVKNFTAQEEPIRNPRKGALPDESENPVNGNYSPDDEDYEDDDDEQVEEDLILGDENEMGGEEEFDVELDDDIEAEDIDEDDLVIDPDDEDDEDDDL
ncbi:MAG: hypothetical protein ACJ75F_07540 [Flavisolibacter sp.]|jgi:hypothetical protein